MRRGPRKRTGAPAYDGEGSVRMVKARVKSVDTVKWTATIIPEDGGMPIEGVPIEPTMVNTSGGGSFVMPETDSLVWACTPSTGTTPFILCGATAPKHTDEGNADEDPNDRRTNRPVLNEGDHVLASNEQGHIIMRKGGVLELGAGEACKRMYIPLTNIIREFSQSWEHRTGGGHISFLTRDQDETYGSERTPVEFQLQIREFAEDSDANIDLRLGRIQDEDDEKVVGGDIGAPVARFNINEMFTVWVDRNGNFQTSVKGTTTLSYHGLYQKTHHANVRDTINGILSQRVQSRSLRVRSNDVVRVEGDREISVEGNLVDTTKKSITREGGELTERYRGVARNVSGKVTESITGSAEQFVGGQRSVGVGGSSDEVVAGTKSTMVAAGVNPNPLATAYSIYVQKGVLSVHDALGKVVFSSGGPDPLVAPAKIIIKPTGSVIIKAALGVVSCELNATGVRLKTPAGSIVLDSAGRVNLGPVAGAGNVLTTLSHPACVVTGVPTLGTPFVTAGNLAAPLPGPGLPAAFVPDKTP